MTDEAGFLRPIVVKPIHVYKIKTFKYHLVPKRSGMAFIRTKRVSGKEYAYLVANSWTASGPRQKVAKYLGRVIRPQKAKSEPLGAFLGLTSEKDLKEWIMKNSFGEIA